MPVINVHPDDLRKMVDKDITNEVLKNDLFTLGLEFDGEGDDGSFNLEFAPDRLDRLSIEGIAFSLRYYYGLNRGVFVPRTNPPTWEIEVKSPVPCSRPKVTGAIVRGIKLNDSALRSIIQLQEKLHDTIGRNRQKGSIGIHDLSLLKGIENSDRISTIIYRPIDPSEHSFVPLGLKIKLTPEEVLEEHPTGKKYKKLLEHDETYPAFFDSVGLFSFPPIINSSRTEVTTDSRDLLIELTGSDQWTIDHMLNIICYALEFRGGIIEEIVIKHQNSTVSKPDLSLETKYLTHSHIEKVLGTEFSQETILDLLERSGLDAHFKDPGYEVIIPPYRVDVLHPLDIIDDIGRTFGFDNLKPRYPNVATIGGRSSHSNLERTARRILVGAGFEDLLNFNLTNEINNFSKMNLDGVSDDYGNYKPVKIIEPYSEEYTIIRTWTLPSLLTVLENNTHRAYPQNLTEIGFTSYINTDRDSGAEEIYTIAAVSAHSQSSYEDAKSRLQFLCHQFNKKLHTPPTNHPSFIPGRTASIIIDGEACGVLGELHPKVLAEHGVELPASAFDFRIKSLL